MNAATVTLVAAILLMPTALAAQQQAGTIPLPRIGNEATITVKTSDKADSVRAAGWLQRQHMSGDWSGRRDSLARRGVVVMVTSVTDGSVGVSRGRAPAAALRSLITGSVELDLDGRGLAGRSGAGSGAGTSGRLPAGAGG
jgi:hypothetical protein